MGKLTIQHLRNVVEMIRMCHSSDYAVEYVQQVLDDLIDEIEKLDARIQKLEKKEKS